MEQDVTAVLIEVRRGSPGAVDRLFELVYHELRHLARRPLKGPGDTLHTTALVNEVYLKLFDQSRLDIRDRSHFFALASRVMRQILVDHFRSRHAEKRGAGVPHMDLEAAEIPIEARGTAILELDAALRKLARIDERLSRVVDYRFFGGMTEAEIGEILGVTDRTVRNDWVKARAWLRRELSA
ncbi:MAG: sigma-70 family RNA polymerase sigma factor [Candidatus Eisenbacteria bacterium]|nr:sigma-70 family RNA polymerase sigma factor [Candidatus Latescibacterota bacterium]MBD3302750.1 sigma-70 family RNA polymerase sigma factor [Candidatus Eisenbacteria bacterium]